MNTQTRITTAFKQLTLKLRKLLATLLVLAVALPITPIIGVGIVWYAHIQDYVHTYTL